MILKAIIVVLILLVAQRIWQITLAMGFDREAYIRRPGPCKNVQPVDMGSEDIVLTCDGIAFISSGIKLDICDYALDQRTKAYTGRIYRFDFNKPDENAVELSLPDQLNDFSPHGMSLWHDPISGEIRLFIVNHRKDGEAVEIVLYDPDSNSLHHLHTIRNQLFTSLNDIVAVGPKSFYAANDGYFRSCWRQLEFLLGLKWSSVVFQDDYSANIVVEGHDFNSLDMSKDGKQIFLTSLTNRKLNIYNRDATDGTLEFLRSIFIGTSIDNVYVDHSSGDLWFGSHPVMHRLATHFGNLDEKAPSQVIRLQPTGPKDDSFKSYKLYAPFEDDGQLISGSSSAVHFQNKVLIGTVSHKLAYCELLH